MQRSLKHLSLSLLHLLERKCNQLLSQLKLYIMRGLQTKERIQPAEYYFDYVSKALGDSL